MKHQPLYLPKGSVRAIVILIMTTFILAAIWSGKIVPEVIIIAWSGMIGWYFGGKIDDLRQFENE